ncbi:hypothetical protein B0A55_06118 [Friedmanniomyces simplex]|uniref:Uncharacterized protein n=1 Tax=Friedmanniomyces simplex TaxID=329884 RepID=A0A4V5NGX7_9PEZI|nr:hypothetical protein B0A55_06118 [Friedmanniomyces simplex]
MAFPASKAQAHKLVGFNVDASQRKMGKKRRRERDRPKGAPDAVYNPNKRVLLSYASDDEHEDGLKQAGGTGHPGAVDSVTANYRIAAYRDDDEQSLGEVDAVGPVLDSVDATGGSKKTDEEPNKSGLFSRGTTKDPMTGQWPALGSTSYQWEEEEDEEGVEYESTGEEAMAYLRAVRHERQTMPAVFHAPYLDEAEELYSSGVGDGRGYFEDGAYVGRPIIGPTMPESARTMIEPQEAYTRALKQRFLETRERMHVMPDSAALATLDEKHPTAFIEGNNKAYASWLRLLQTSMPHPVQVQSMDIGSVGRLLELIMKLFLVREQHLAKTTSVWIWSLLARLDEVGTMSNDEVYAIREFGKKAVLVQLSLHDPAAAAQLEEVSRDSEGVPVSTNGAVAKNETYGDEPAPEVDQSLPKMSDTDSSAAENTLVALDMIITIIGEVFGQRDLLEFRRPWEVAEDKADRTTDSAAYDAT